MHRGYIKYWRKIRDWSWYKDSKTKSLFLHLVAEANHKPYVFLGHKIDRGQIAVGRHQLRIDTGISEQSIRTSLRRLKSTSDITTKSTSNFSIISIVNYEQYQGNSTSGSTSNLTINQPASNQLLTTIEECKNDKKEAYTQPFEVFWGNYPSRNGKKLTKQDSFKKFKELSTEDALLVITAAKNYASSSGAKDGYAKDAVRFFKNDFWREWITQENKQSVKSEVFPDAVRI
jgi:hypothetical protein